MKKENAYFCSDFFVHKISSVYILYKQDVHASQTKALDKKEEKEEKIKLQCLKEKGKKSYYTKLLLLSQVLDYQ